MQRNMATIFSSSEVSLRWNNFSSNLTSGFFSHLSENDLVDVTIAVEGRLLAAHKLVLSVCSPYFKNIFKENPCQHPVIILKDVKYEEITSLLKFMYQGEVNVKQDDLPTLLKVAKMLQISGLDITALSDGPSEQGSVSKAADKSAHSHRIAKRNTRTRKKRMAEDDYDSVKKLRNESNVDKDDDICLLSDTNERDANDSNSEKDIRHNETTEAINNSEEIIELSNEQNLERNSLLQSAVEPVIYRLSARGKPQLVHEGYVYNMTSRTKANNSSHYRCAMQHRGCRGKCSVIAETFMPTGVHQHNHPPSYQSEYDYRMKKGLDTDNV
ncbi:uncharacterized protein [Temnothorax longispinosus]|uniref:uncharacterized protein isoform X3 n=1 Tax=Temnothorax longispinosus TaxID=300112 RepID=UPI003A99F637